MKKLTRRELFRGTGAAAVSGAALAVGLKPAKARFVGIGACSRVGKSYPGLYPEWSRIVNLRPVDTELELLGLTDLEALIREYESDLWHKTG